MNEFDDILVVNLEETIHPESVDEIIANIRDRIEDKQNPYADYFTTVPFNCWGDSFLQNVNDIKSRVIHRKEDLGFIDYLENCRFFSDKFDKDYNKLLPMLSAGELLNPSRRLEDWIFYLAEDYYTRLKQEHAITHDGLASALSLWIWAASSIVNMNLIKKLDWLQSDESAYLRQNARALEWYNTLCEFRDGQQERLNSAFVRIQGELSAHIAKMREQPDQSMNTVHHEAQSNDDFKSYVPSRDVFKKASQESIIKGIVFTNKLPKEKHQRLFKIIDDAVSSNRYYIGFAYIKVAINKGYIRTPTFPEVEKAFGRYKGKERNYSAFMGKRGFFSETMLSHEHTELLKTVEADILGELELV